MDSSRVRIIHGDGSLATILTSSFPVYYKRGWDLVDEDDAPLVKCGPITDPPLSDPLHHVTNADLAEYNLRTTNVHGLNSIHSLVHYTDGERVYAKNGLRFITTNHGNPITFDLDVDQIQALLALLED